MFAPFGGLVPWGIFGLESAAHVSPCRPASISEKGRPTFRFRRPCPSLCAKTI
jgi:hypothetical protein